MNKIPGILLFSLSVLVCSCDREKEKEPTLPKSYRISHIECEKDNYSQTFEYNEKGLISRWEECFDDPWGKYKSGIESTYEYSDDDSVIKISSDERIWSTERRVFSETMYMNADGTAKRAEGNVVIYYSDSDYELRKYYTAEFQYDSLNQLTNISIAEKCTDFDGWEDQKSLDWCVKIEWHEGNMVAYSEYTSSSRFSLMAKSTYEYYGDSFVDYMPIVTSPILRYFYLPLQYQGMLGKRSDSLMKRKTIFEIILGEEKSSYTSDYSYDLSTSIHDTRVEAFGTVRSYDEEELKYTVDWEAK